jgi:hypothetical protein
MDRANSIAKGHRRRVRVSLVAALILSPFLGRGVSLAQPCPGDCDGGGQITIDELVTVRRIAGGVPGASLGDCEAADLDASGDVSAAEVMEIEQEAIGRCAPQPSEPPPPPQPVTINAAALTAGVGAVLAMRVSVTSTGVIADAFQNYLAYGQSTRFLPNQSGSPDCSLSSEAEGALATFAFSPPGCDPAVDCERVLAFVDASAADVEIGGLKIVYRCQVQVAADAPLGFRPINVLGVASSDAEGNTLATSAFNGGILVRPPATPTPTFTETPTATPTASETPTATPTETFTASATPSPTETATNTPVATDTPTPTVAATSSPTPTATPSATATATPTATPTATVPVAECTGDCDADGTVTVAELIRAVRIALGAGSVDDCPSLDANGDGTVGVEELVAAVRDALGPCAGEPVSR